ncbi:MAG: NAD-dependent epimerase/dehydratase family protein [Gemmataceae bacterium]|nr:NAD-dependent epimerase/dehydratase family protein [Gemmataceae bacterium]
MAVCLVTGGAGFIGSHLVEALRASGHTVRVLDNFSTGARRNLAEVEGAIELIQGDLQDFDVVREAVAGVDYVFHHAAPVASTNSLEDPVSAHHGGATGTLHVLMAAREARVQRVIYASSCCVYGAPTAAPRREDESLRPLSSYAVAKLMGEQHCVSFTGQYGLPTVRLRYFNVFGPRQPLGGPYAAKLNHILYAMLAGHRPLLHGGTLEQHDLMYVDDVVHANLLAATAPRVSGKVYNIASGRPVATMQLVATLNEILGTNLVPFGIVPDLRDDTDHHLACIDKAEVELGFCPSTSLANGLRRCVEYCRRQVAKAVR